MMNPPESIGALSDIPKDVTSPQAMPLGEMPEGSVEQVGEDYGVIAQFGGPTLEDHISIYKEGNGYYGSGHNFDFSANDLPDLMQKLRKIGATELYYGKL